MTRRVCVCALGYDISSGALYIMTDGVCCVFVPYFARTCTFTLWSLTQVG